MTSVSAQKSTRLADVLSDAVRAKTNVAARQTASTAENQSAVPTNNPFYKIMFDESLDPEAKKAAITKLLTFTGSKEESRAHIKEYAEFEAFMQATREAMATNIIRMQDNETMGILQNVINNLNGQLLDFERQMQPLTDITDAIYTLRTKDATLDVYREIREDKEREEKEKITAEEREHSFTDVQTKIRAIEDLNAKLGEEKTFFGMGGLTKKARQDMATNKLELDRLDHELERIQTEIAESSVKSATEPGEFSKEKAKLRELLDLTSEQHKERQQALVSAALTFVTSAKRDIGEVKNHLERMNGQIGNLLDNNTKMATAYAVMSEGIEDAQKDNHSERTKFSIHPEGERSIQKMQREESLMAVDDHIRMLDNAIRTTTSATADLTTQTVRVKGMKDANEQTLETTRVLHTQGVAGIADRLSSTLQAVSSAALGESSAAAKDTLRKMNEATDRISQRESIRNALGIQEMNNDLQTALASLADYGEVQRHANEITKAGLAEISDSLSKIKQSAAETQSALHESFSAAAEMTKPKDAEEQKESGPFKI